MSVGERDPYTGHMTTGHQWNGIKELNTRLPRLQIICFLAAFLFAVGYWIMMPTWPLGDTYTKGRLGFNQSQVLAEDLAQARENRAQWEERIATEPFESITADESLMAVVQQAGPQLYGENCAACHGPDGAGARNFPSLKDDAWLWDNSADSIAHTLRVGINSLHPESRIAQMPALGETGALDAAGVSNAVAYVQSLGSGTLGTGPRAADVLAVNAGARTYQTVCAGCHGPDGAGNQALGAPNLTDDAWIYGNDRDALHHTIQYGRAGHMPSWESRLSVAERRILALHVLSLSAGSDEVGVESASGGS